MPYSGCYSLEFYCDDEAHVIDKDTRYYNVPYLETIGHTRADCIRQGKQAGWEIKYKTHKCYCPECSKNKEVVKC